MSYVLKLDNLCKRFGGVNAVSNVSFSIDSNQVMGIIGPNGAGKTTLFNLISGFLKPTEGRVFFYDREITGLKPHKIVRRGLARSFQIAESFPNMTVEETILISLFHAGRTGKKSLRELRNMASETLSPVGLSDKKQTRVKDLTQGELKMLDILRAAGTNPRLLLLDEPFAGLGFQEIRGLTNLISELGKSSTIIIIEHKLKELINLVARIIVIDFGQVIADDAPEEIVRNQKVIDSYLGEGEI